VFQEMGTMKSLHWRFELWFDCVERKRRAKLPASATAPRAFRYRAVLAAEKIVHSPIKSNMKLGPQTNLGAESQS